MYVCKDYKQFKKVKESVCSMLKSSPEDQICMYVCLRRFEDIHRFSQSETKKLYYVSSFLLLYTLHIYILGVCIYNIYT